MVRVRITNRGDAAGQLWSLLRAHHFDITVTQEPVSPSLVGSIISSGRDVLGGQTTYSAGNNIYVDGRRLPQPYLPPHDRLGPPIPAATRQAPVHVPRGLASAQYPYGVPSIPHSIP
jgi:hypothetical protein